MDPFATLGVPRRFSVDIEALEKRHRDLSRALHPDKFVGAGASERRATLGKAVEVNEAWRAVRDPIRRAEALFKLAGIAVGERNEPKASSAFLMDVMEMREELSESRASRDVAALEKLKADVERRAASCTEVLAKGLDEADNAARAASLLPSLGELRFYRRFLEEVSAIEDEWAA
jgi:molecular chaperone HscB